MANQFYIITLKTLEKLESIHVINSSVILKYWKESLIDQNINYIKGCPKNLFISLVLNNKLVFDNSKSLINDFFSKEYIYSLKAIEILKSSNDVGYSSSSLWKLVTNSLEINRVHQGEMDVVLALWESGRIR